MVNNLNSLMHVLLVFTGIIQKTQEEFLVLEMVLRVLTLRLVEGATNLMEHWQLTTMSIM